MSTSQPIATGVEVTLDKPRRLSFDFFACWAAEKAYADRFNEKKITPFIDLVFEGTYGGLVCALWAGLLKEDPKLTLEQVNAMIRPRQMNELSTLIIRCTLDQVAAPEDEEKGDAEEEKEKKTTDSATKTAGVKLQPTEDMT